jgi:hypothetical protein
MLFFGFRRPLHPYVKHFTFAGPHRTYGSSPVTRHRWMREAADIGRVPITAPDVPSLEFEPSASKTRRAMQQ